jgi:hypothetical protein
LASAVHLPDRLAAKSGSAHKTINKAVDTTINLFCMEKTLAVAIRGKCLGSMRGFSSEIRDQILPPWSTVMLSTWMGTRLSLVLAKFPTPLRFLRADGPRSTER